MLRTELGSEEAGTLNAFSMDELGRQAGENKISPPQPSLLLRVTFLKGYSEPVTPPFKHLDGFPEPPN